ncbi:Chemotaxis protein [Desulfonema limicola]|uniref:Chemotaxis protein n=1 Tax=Desulfonema limicola TaxID=45656 RepID=A0A975B4Z2_9BACT|nr:chemotaxis protein CheW [Desulfonema limicola]QTA78874.1 Chemotaxis protein [Desulfonema limicola]
MKDKKNINTNHSNEYLTFKFGKETFAIKITSIKEVINYTKITKVPRLAEHLKGIINLRGNIISIIDVRIKLGIKIMEENLDTCIIITEIQDKDEIIQTGIPADSVQEVLYLSKNQINSSPRVGIKINKDYLKGIGLKNDTPVLILDIEKIIADDNQSENNLY